MPYKIAGQPGTWYEPGARKGNTTIVWRGRLPDGAWTELATDAQHQSGAQAFVRRALERWHRDRPPPSGTPVELETAAHHYKAARARSEIERTRIDRVVGWVGAGLDVRAINQTHLTLAAGAFREQRARENAAALREKRQTFPPPSTATVNREVTTPLRAVLNFAEEQAWRPKIVLRAIKPAENEMPSPLQKAARDADVDRLLQRIAEQLATAQPKGRRQLNHLRHLKSLRALYALVTVVHERGYRISEWLRWDWETIHLQQASATILLSKPRRWVEFDLSANAVAALAALPALDRGKVFPWRQRSQVYQAVDKQGIHWRPHESRRAVVTAVLRNTGDPTVAQRYVSHASIKTTLRYRVVDPEETGPQARAGGSRGKMPPGR